MDFAKSVYTRALALELRRRGLRVEREVWIAVYYKGEVRSARYRIDMLVEGCVVLEIKATVALAPSDRDQLLNYLRGSRLEVGLLLHFGPRPTFQRVVAENARSCRSGRFRVFRAIAVPTGPGAMSWPQVESSAAIRSAIRSASGSTASSSDG